MSDGLNRMPLLMSTWMVRLTFVATPGFPIGDSWCPPAWLPAAMATVVANMAPEKSSAEREGRMERENVMGLLSSDGLTTGEAEGNTGAKRRSCAGVFHLNATCLLRWA